MNNSVLITGGTGLIGRQIIQEFITKGWTVYFTSTSENKAKKLMDFYKSDSIHKIVVDFYNEDACEKIIDLLPDSIDAVIHNARDARNLQFTEGIVKDDHFLKELQMSVVSPYHLTHLLIDKKSLKDVIFISSMYGLVSPNPLLYDDYESSSFPSYGTSKAAQIHLTKELAVRYAKGNVRVNAISYGGVKGRANAEFVERYTSLCPMGRMLDLVDDIFPPIWFIVSNRRLTMTGQNIQIDGGWTLI
tara:strand:+ start:816 stop:1553 length:738 start_codon:yes stop_codon:yes gene_type:complete